MKTYKKSAVYTLLFSLIILLSLAGCTTTSDKPKPVTDKQKLLDNRLQLSIRYIQTGNHERAREHLKRAEEINGRSPQVHDLYALLYEREREFKVAENHFKKALSYDSSFTRGRNNYGSFLLRQGRAKDACDQFKRGADDLGYARRFELYYKIGLCESSLGQEELASDAFLKSLALNQQFSQASLELAQIAYDNKNYPEAKKYLSHYNNNRNRPSARGLWLGIRLEHLFDNKDARDSHALALKNLFPESQENLLYQNWLKNGYEF